MHRHSLHCILPPHLLQAIVERSASPRQRRNALSTLSTDQTVRALRGQLQLRAPLSVGRPQQWAAEGRKHRTIYTAGHSQKLPGQLVRSEEGGPSGDPAADEAFDGLGATFDLYWEVYDRNSIDDEGLPLDATVHFGQSYDNAFWDGERMVFGDGDGDLFNRFTVAVDIIGHELTHGVIDDEAKLAYFHQAGALNESVADVFGTLVKQRHLKQTTDQADWLIGAGLFTPGVKGKALRSMKEPGTAYDDPVLGKDPQPGHMRDFVHTLEDNGGVHVNSGIPNHAFALTALALGGHAWEKAGRIWYEALKDPRLKPTSGFRSFAARTVAWARRLYGEASGEQQAVRESWNEVGVPVPNGRGE